jgi:NifB/MoaA-like Fe-S oxidoreductase
VAIVPVVFTKLHNYSHLLTAVTAGYSRALIKEMRPLQREFRRRFGTTFVFLADEFYLRAGLPLPGRAHYGDYPQIEDGVGMVRRFVVESKKAIARDLATELTIERGTLYGTIATGKLFYPILSKFVGELNDRLGTRLKVISAENRFFGEEVTVAGLLTGGDLLAARAEIEGDFLIVPEQACLKQGQIFLDDLSLEDIERELRIPVFSGGQTISSMLERAAQANRARTKSNRAD